MTNTVITAKQQILAQTRSFAMTLLDNYRSRLIVVAEAGSDFNERPISLT